MEESAATGAAAGRGRGGRFSAGCKRETVLRLLRGEDLESVVGGNWGSRRRGPRSGAISFWPRAGRCRPGRGASRPHPPGA